VVIKNVGTAPVVDAFWVDFYIDPSEPPSLNKIWQDLSTQGIAWGVTDPIPVNGVITLTIGGTYYVPNESNFIPPLQVGTPIWAQVDAVNLLTTYGGVLESHEIVGGVYNNVISTVSIAGSSVVLPAAINEAATVSSGDLPRRE
jgi:hypothetical protein